MQEALDFVSQIHLDSKFPDRSDVAKTLGSKERQSLPYYTKYEYTKILSVRIHQLSCGATPMTSLDGMDQSSTDFLRLLATKEILEQKLPYIICRVFPDKTVEYWSTMELQVL